MTRSKSARDRHNVRFELGAGESEAFWLEFPHSIKKRGLEKTMLVTSDAHIRTLLVNVDEDWRAGRRHMGKEGVEKIFKRSLERKNIEFILEEAVINLEAHNAIYTT